MMHWIRVVMGVLMIGLWLFGVGCLFVVMLDGLLALARRVRLRRVVGEEERIPRGYGVAWLDYARMVAVCYPLLLNCLVGLARRVRLRLAAGVRDRELTAAYRRGFFEGRESMFEELTGDIEETRGVVEDVEDFLDERWGE